MGGRDNRREQAGIYDRIFRENMEAALPVVLKNLLGIPVAEQEALTDSIQHTKERKTDVLRKVTDRSGRTFILHMEYQVRNDSDMAYRMAEYCIMILRKYRLPVKQYVLFLGPGRVGMPAGITEENLQFRYSLVRLRDIDYRLFLASPEPEEKILAVLGNFGKDDPASAVQQIVCGIRESTPGDLAAGRYLRQLRVLAQLRNLDLTNTAVMGDISKYFSHEKDIMYKYGRAKAIEEEKTQFVRNLLENTDFSDDRIALLAGVPVKLVQKMRTAVK